MKRIFTVLCLMLAAVCAFAQSAKEIVSRMEALMSDHEDEGYVMTVEIKIPIVGSIETLCYQLGERFRMEVAVLDKKMITWTDGATTWVYDSEKNEVEISGGPADTQSNAQMFEDISAGYDITIDKQTADAWYLSCKRSKTNKDKDAPKKMDIVIAKGTFHPISLSTKEKGVTLTIRDIKFGATKELVTFNKNAYPGVKVVDKR